MREWLKRHFKDDESCAKTMVYVGAVGGGVGFALVLLGTIMIRYSA
jgi:hypothetical protein